ncbi:MAG: hypothetical protein C5B51_11145 [Terriglobia bacterium]|nr:MAG: hypothetical protein C5B51_11145 [Terriglobia bacterium]
MPPRIHSISSEAFRGKVTMQPNTTRSVLREFKNRLLTGAAEKRLPVFGGNCRAATARERSGERGSTMILLMMMLPLFMVPLVGLAIDGTLCYIVQAKLAAAVDGAALGAGRLLGTPANTNEIAAEFLNVNFPTGYWGSRNLQPSISSTTVLATHTINVSATVDVPLLFLRVIGQDHSTVASAATATRTDSRIVLVLDRSGSMNNVDPVSGLNVFTTMQSSAKSFVGMFNPGTDELGLVIFSGGGVVAYPMNWPYNYSASGPGGPDVNFGTSPTAGTMINQINAMTAGGGTGTSEALALAYIELQKAHNRDLAQNGTDSRLNAIVLFTDGVPTTLSVNANDNTNASTNSLKSPGSTSCTYNPENSNASTHMTGWIGVPGNPPGWGTPVGLHLIPLTDTNAAHNLAYWMNHPSYDTTVSSMPTSALSGCAYLDNPNTGSHAQLNDLRQIPPYDLYGNSTTGNMYIYSSVDYNGTAYNPAQPTNGYQVGLGIWNAVDNSANTIRSMTAMGTIPAPTGSMNPIQIFTIGYTGNGGVDAGLLKRVANTQDCQPMPNVNEQIGQYFEVHSADQLNAAFIAVASEILRLSK